VAGNHIGVPVTPMRKARPSGVAGATAQGPVGGEQRNGKQK